MKKTESYASYMKSPYHSVKHVTYFGVYDDLFARYRGKPITFVEIGVLGGGSLFMWRDFFGPAARIIGVDFNPNAKKWESQGFEIFIGNQGDESFWEDFIKKVGPVDVVLDDGGHTYAQQIITTESLLKNIKDGGMLVVEDTHTSYMSGYGLKKYSFIEYVKKFSDRIGLRFGFKGKGYDSRVWSIQIYESIVAFHVNRKFSEVKQSWTENNGEKDGAKDFRHADNVALSALEKSASKKKILGYKTLNSILRHLSTNYKSIKTTKYFK